MNKKEFKKLQSKYLELNKELEKLNKIYKQQIKPFEEEFFTSSMDDTEIDKLVRKDMEIRENLHIDKVEIELMKVKNSLITEGLNLLKSLNIPENERKLLEYTKRSYKNNIYMIDKLADIFARMQV